MKVRKLKHRAQEMHGHHDVIVSCRTKKDADWDYHCAMTYHEFGYYPKKFVSQKIVMSHHNCAWHKR